MRIAKLVSILMLTIVSITLYAQEKKQITLEDIWVDGTFNAKSVHGLKSMNDGLNYTSIDSEKEGTEINQYAYKIGKKVKNIVQLYDSTIFGKDFSMDEYQFNADETKLLLATETERIYRHSTIENNYVYDIKTKKLQPLSDNGKQCYATFSPSGNKVAFVRDNNIFIKDLETGEESQITKDGKYNFIINGSTDWVYEEEFGFDKAFFWSPDGNTIAFYRFDESNVKQFSMDMYGSLYPTQYQFKYPKAGEENAKVSIHVYHLDTKTTDPIQLENWGEYIPRIKWTKDPKLLCITQMNRLQNKLELILVNVKELTNKVLLTETSKTYIDITDNLTFLSDMKHFIWSSEKDGYQHLYLYNMDGKEKVQITKGSWEVSDFLGVDEKTNTVYYTATESSPMERELYTIKLDGTAKKKLSDKKGWNSVNMSKSFNYYINSYSNANTLSFVTLHNIQGRLIRVLESNEDINNTLTNYDISPKMFFNFTTSDGISLNGWMIKPSHIDATKKYPVLMYVYGGPGVQTVEDTWDRNYLWYQMMAQKGYIIVSVDNRGTGARGRDFKHSTYKQLGKLETIDQIETAQYLQSLPYVDGKRIGIWGWSYGGYMSSLCITKGADYFKTAVAVAPVSNWRFYDTIYTERFMQTPQDNPDGYDDNSPINHVDKLKSNLLIIHGMADDNVHFQNTVEMVDALIKANKQFDLYIYPNKNHSIYGGNTRYHLFTKITNYFIENL